MNKPVVIELQNTGFAPSNESIAKHLREQADRIESDEEGVRNVFMIIETMEGQVYRQAMGQSCDFAREIGVITIACIRGAMGAE